MSGVRLTCRCTVCGINWPYDSAFTICPLCDSATKPLKFLADNKDHILTSAEAKRQSAPQPAEEELVVALHDDLDQWETTRPKWLKKK